MRKKVIFIGQLGVGKTTIATLLSEKLRLQSIDLDHIRWYYYYKQGYSVSYTQALRQQKDFRKRLYPYWNPLG